jgi:aspartyl-tRNA(Asn)/glutamyl-tRNA(Gln) amidotransferase subunit A
MRRPMAGQIDQTLSRRRFVAASAVAGAAAAAGPAVAAARSRRSRSAVSLLPNPDAVGRAAGHPADLGVLEAASLLQAGRLSPAELLGACLGRIDRRNGPIGFDGSATAINAFVRRYDDVAQRAASTATQRLSRSETRRLGRRPPLLTGIPVGLKDLYAVEGLPLTASSHILDGNVARGDSTVWRRLSFARMVLTGHTHTDEFAFLAMTPQCGNPWNTAYVTGGSSGGSAAALAARMLPAATGSDTFGSLRIPAGFCGVSSIKPTYGVISGAGVIPLAWSFDTCGPMARSVADCSLLLSAIAGRDGDDPSTDVAYSRPARYPLAARTGAQPLRGTRIGIPRSLGGALTAGPAEIYSRTQSELQALGATLVPVDEPANPFSTPLEFYTESLAYHRQWFPARASDYKPPTAQMLALVRGLDLSALDYLGLQRTRAAYIAGYKRFLADQRLDVVAVPVSLADPPQRSDPRVLSPATNPENSQLLTFAYSYLGFPVVTVPGGASKATGLPVGIQLVGGPFSDSRLVQLAIDVQAHYPHYREQPPGLGADPA